jgi:hypothetical protein
METVRWAEEQEPQQEDCQDFEDDRERKLAPERAMRHFL